MLRLLATLIVPASLTVALIAAQPDDKKPIKVINLDKLNTAKDEDDPHVSSSGLTLLYSTNTGKKFDLFITRRADLGRPWVAGKPIGDYVQTEADDRSAFLTRDGVIPLLRHKERQADEELRHLRCRQAGPFRCIHRANTDQSDQYGSRRVASLADRGRQGAVL
jgi:hypothetical protein